MKVRAEILLPIAEAARRIGMSRQALTKVVRSGRLKGYCALCGGGLALDILQGIRGHRCPQGLAKKYRVGVRDTDLPTFIAQRAAEKRWEKARRSHHRKTQEIPGDQASLARGMTGA